MNSAITLPPYRRPDDPDPGPVGLEAAFAPFRERMAAAGCSEAAIVAFGRHYAQLWAGETGLIPGSQALPVPDLPQLGDATPAGGPLDRLAVIKLNGGLGTSMGLSGPKSLLEVRDGLSFLDVTARQVLAIRAATGARLPLLLMNSFHTDAPSMAALGAYPDLARQGGVPPSFLQGQVPKVLADDLSPADWPPDPAKAWCPPGHGEVYTALWQGGTLDRLLAAGIEVAFISNIDNLGATVDPAILGLLEASGAPFVMEVAARTAADRKGGHLAQGPDGRLLLREVAQCPPEELAEFQDIERYRYFNTNSLWVRLPSLKALLDARQGSLDLPLIRNRKALDPARPDSPAVYQLESAMGAAIESFEGAMAVVVPRARFRPVKKGSDLLGLWSDAYELDEAGHVDLRPERGGRAPEIDLDDAYFGSIDALRLRFPHGAPSLAACDRLTVRGDVRFGRGVRVRGDVNLSAPDGEALRVPDGAVLDG